MALMIEDHPQASSRGGRGMASRSSFVDPKAASGLTRDDYGKRRWLAEGPEGQRAPLLRRLLGVTEWSKEERSRGKVAVREYRQKWREFETQRQRADYEWQRRGFPELKKKVYYKWGVPAAQATAQNQKNPHYEQQYALRLASAEKELKYMTEQRTKDRQKERYATQRELTAALTERRKTFRAQMADEWYSAHNQGHG